MEEVRDRAGASVKRASASDGHGRSVRLLKAFTHPLRVAILARLDEAVLSPKELASELEVSLPVVSYHVRELERLRMIELVRTAQRRGAVQHWYRARVGVPFTERDWRAMPRRTRREVVGVSLARLEAAVAAATDEGGFDRPGAQLHHEARQLDEQAFTEMGALLGEFRDRATEIGEAAQSRLESSDGAPPVKATFALMLFEGPYGGARRARSRH